MEIEAQDYINALTNQRNALMDECAKLAAYAAKLERQLAAAQETVKAPKAT